MADHEINENRIVIPKEHVMEIESSRYEVGPPIYVCADPRASCYVIHVPTPELIPPKLSIVGKPQPVCPIPEH